MTILLLLVLLLTGAPTSLSADTELVRLRQVGHVQWPGDSGNNPGFISKLFVSGNRGFIAHYGNFYHFDLSNPGFPKLASSPAVIPNWSTVGGDLGLAIYGESAVLANGGVRVISLSHLPSFYTIGAIEMPYSTGWMDLFGSLAYLVGGVGAQGAWRGVHVIDLSDPSAPRPVASVIDQFEGPYGGASSWITIINGLGFVGKRICGFGGAVDILDLEKPNEPRRIGRMEGIGWPVAISVRGTHAYVVDEGWDCKRLWPAVGLVAFDLAEPAAPRRLGTYPVGHDGDGHSTSSLDMAVWGDYLLVVCRPGRVEVFDTSRPEELKRVGRIEMESVFRIAVEGRIAYVTGTEGLSVLEMVELQAFKRVEQTASGMFLEWTEAARGMKLQKTASLAAPDWQDVIGSETQVSTTLPHEGDRAFFRLVRP